MDTNPKSLLLCTPGEIRNRIYKAILEDTPKDGPWHEVLACILGLASVNKQLRQEAFSYFFRYATINITSTLELDELECFLSALPGHLGWPLITRIGFPNYLETALSRARADQLMRFCQQAPTLRNISFNIRLEHMAVNRFSSPDVVQGFALELGLDQLHTLSNLKQIVFICTFYDGAFDLAMAPPTHHRLFCDIEVWTKQELSTGDKVVDVTKAHVDVPAHAVTAFAWDIVRA